MIHPNKIQDPQKNKVSETQAPVEAFGATTTAVEKWVPKTNINDKQNRCSFGNQGEKDSLITKKKEKKKVNDYCIASTYKGPFGVIEEVFTEQPPKPSGSLPINERVMDYYNLLKLIQRNSYDPALYKRLFIRWNFCFFVFY
ncbi:unnamed protein product [Cuscuta epithymum]|uniref:Uncharacterized protein n=1 Tax=Cuscuta epithymum TaxID=186058 RepID=A0AAV0ECC3_9ASTE|nr:unnamed protein product [Cuscuta epithymum]